MKGFFLFARLWLWALLLASGCRTPGYEEREADASRFRDVLREETRAYFATNRAPLTLADALVLARSRTLKLTQQQLNRQLAEITRETAFAVFLPQVDAAFARQGTDKPIMRSLGSLSVQMSDQYASSSSVTLTQPIFTPAPGCYSRRQRKR